MPKFEVSQASNIEVRNIIQECKCGDLSLRVLSKKDKNQLINFKAELFQDGKVIATTGDAFVEYWKSPKQTPGEFTLKIYPETDSSFPEYKKVPFGEEFIYDVVLHYNETTDVKVLISRKESIIYDINYKFHVTNVDEKVGSEPLIEIRAFNELSENSTHIFDSSNKFKIEVQLVKSIMYMETTHGWYDAPLDIVDMNKSIRPMNVNVEYWVSLFDRDELYEKSRNVDAGSYLLKLIINRDVSNDISVISTLYNNINAIKVNDYGARVSNIYSKKLYIPPKNFFDKVKESASWFENLNPKEQLNVLRRMFGGY